MVVLLLFLGAVGGFSYWNSPKQHFRRGLAALQANDLESVEYESSYLRGVTGYDPHARLLRAGALLRAPRPEHLREALEELDYAVEHPDTHILAMTLGAEAQYLLGDYRRATELLSRILEDDPDNVEAHRWSAAAYYDMGAMQHALFHMRRVAELDPADPRPYWMIGTIYKDAGNLNAAEENYRRVLQLADGGSAGQTSGVDMMAVRFELAQIEAESGRYRVALETLASCPESADVLALKGICQVNLKQIEQARESFREALRLEPNHLAALRFLGQLALDAGELDSSDRYLSLAVMRYPKDAETHELLSRVRRQQDRGAEADQEKKLADVLRQKRVEFQSLQLQLAASPADTQLRNRIGKLALELDLPDLAMRNFRASLEVSPNDPEAIAGIREIMGQMAPPPMAPTAHDVPLRDAPTESR